jgi:hypothetical protein
MTSLGVYLTQRVFQVTNVHSDWTASHASNSQAESVFFDADLQNLCKIHLLTK